MWMTKMVLIAPEEGNDEGINVNVYHMGFLGLSITVQDKKTPFGAKRKAKEAQGIENGNKNMIKPNTHDSRGVRRTMTNEVSLTSDEEVDALARALKKGINTFKEITVVWGIPEVMGSKRSKNISTEELEELRKKANAGDPLAGLFLEKLGREKGVLE